MSTNEIDRTLGIVGDVTAGCHQVMYPADRHGPAAVETTITLSGSFTIAGHPQAIIGELAAVIEKYRI